jgi:hypothetical protein
MMKTVEYRDRRNMTNRLAHVVRIGNTLTDTLMRAGMIEVVNVLRGSAPQVTFTQDQNVIETFMADTAEETFTERVSFGCRDRCVQYLDARGNG